MGVIVQRFGSTSISTEDKREIVSNKVLKAINNGYSPVVVISAMEHGGEPYTTDTLLSLINSEINKRELDLLQSCGEIISGVILSNTLEKMGIKARVFTGGQAGIRTDYNYGEAKVLSVDTKRLLETVKENIVPIVAGFQGMTANLDFTTLGRLDSDVTATILGDALKADAIEIYTDIC